MNEPDGAALTKACVENICQNGPDVGIRLAGAGGSEELPEGVSDAFMLV